MAWFLWLSLWGAVTTFYTPRQYMDSPERREHGGTRVWPGTSAGSQQVCLQDLKQEGTLFTPLLGNMCLVSTCWGRGHGGDKAR